MKASIHRRLEALEGPTNQIGEGWGDMPMPAMTRATVREMVLAIIKRGSTLGVVGSLDECPAGPAVSAVEPRCSEDLPEPLQARNEGPTGSLGALLAQMPGSTILVVRALPEDFRQRTSLGRGCGSGRHLTI